MQKIVLLVLIYLLSCSCNTYDLPKCTFNDATQELSWLKEIIDNRNANPTEDMKYCYITQARNKRKTVFVFNDCNPTIFKTPQIYNCEGNIITKADGENVGVNDIKLKNERIIWQPVDFVCKLN